MQREPASRQGGGGVGIHFGLLCVGGGVEARSAIDRPALCARSPATVKLLIGGEPICSSGQMTPQPSTNPCPAQPVDAATLPVALLHVDAHLIVVDKPAGLLAVPGKGEAGRDNLATRVQALHADALIVHRLDQATSGLMVMARGLAAQRALSRGFEQREVEKAYEAVVEGWLDAEAGEVDAPLAADWPQRPKQKVDLTAGRPALTRWLRLDAAAPPGCTRLRLHPLTGRTHQLRVHMAHIGHPIRGDALYAPWPLGDGRLLLHSVALGFRHPDDGRWLRFHSPAPF